MRKEFFLRSLIVAFFWTLLLTIMFSEAWPTSLAFRLLGIPDGGVVVLLGNLAFWTLVLWVPRSLLYDWLHKPVE